MTNCYLLVKGFVTSQIVIITKFVVVSGGGGGGGGGGRYKEGCLYLSGAMYIWIKDKDQHMHLQLV